MAGLVNKDIPSWQTGTTYANALKQCASAKLKKTVSGHIISSNGEIVLTKENTKWPRYQYLEVAIAILPRVIGKA